MALVLDTDGCQRMVCHLRESFFLKACLNESLFLSLSVQCPLEIIFHNTSEVSHSRCPKISLCLIISVFLWARNQTVEEFHRVFKKMKSLVGVG